MDSGWTYKRAGVDITRDDALSAYAIQKSLDNLTGFAEIVGETLLLRADFKGMREPCLKFAADGVGTKLKYAFASGRHTSVGIDLVAMCVNDLLRYNARPVAFLDYIAKGKIDDEVVKQILDGVAEGCRRSDCAILGGEIATMADFYQEGEYDLAGFAVGIVDKEKIITGGDIEEGDLIFGLPSSGLHSNGLSLVRELFPPEEVAKDPKLLADILEPTRIYVKSVLAVNQLFKVHGWAHITGGGITGKLGKIIPEGLLAELYWGTWTVHNIFGRIREAGVVPEEEMHNTFNEGLGMIGVAASEDSRQIVDFLKGQGEEAYIVGKVVKTTLPLRVNFKTRPLLE